TPPRWAAPFARCCTNRLTFKMQSAFKRRSGNPVASTALRTSSKTHLAAPCAGISTQRLCPCASGGQNGGFTVSRGLSEKEIDELMDRARMSCEATAAYRMKSEAGCMSAEEEAAIRRYLDYLDVRIEALKCGRRPKPKVERTPRRHKIIPLASYTQWRVAK